MQKIWIPREKVVRQFERECICCFLKTMAIFLLSSMPNPKHLYNSIKEMPIYHVCSFDAGDDDDDDGDDDADDDDDDDDAMVVWSVGHESSFKTVINKISRSWAPRGTSYVT